MLLAAALALALPPLLWAGGLVWFAGLSPPREAETAATDAIVVLTGGSQRLQSGLDLLREGKGRKLFISGVNHQVELGDLLRVAGHPPDWAATCCIILGHDADNTLGNARETARWMQQEGYHSLRLVTAWYHMRRSLLEFQRAMPGIAILPHPVFPDRMQQRHWWEERATATLIVGEYDKYLATLLRPLLDRLHPAGSGFFPTAA
jgi:uncharacterized SAM-binding protein YcdF (DUF218 family)